MTKLSQSFANLEKAFTSLKKAVSTPPVEERDFAGIIQSFEFVYELTWKTLKIILETNGVEAPFPRIVFEEAYKKNMIDGNEIWTVIMDARNKTTHTYDQKLAIKICEDVKEKYVQVFEKTLSKMKPYIK